MLGHQLPAWRCKEASVPYPLLVSRSGALRKEYRLMPECKSKPYTCLAGYGDPIFVPKEVQEYVDKYNVGSAADCHLIANPTTKSS